MKSRKAKTSTACSVERLTGPHPAPHPALKGCFTYCFFRSGLRLKEELHRRFEEFGLITPQFGILAILKAEGPLNQITLGEQMGIDKATMVRMLDGLEKAGAVERTPSTEDRRAKAVRVTPHGIKLCAKADAARKGVEDEFLSVLSPAHRKIFKQEISKLLFK